MDEFHNKLCFIYKINMVVLLRAYKATMAGTDRQIEDGFVEILLTADPAVWWPMMDWVLEPNRSEKNISI